MRYEVVGSGNTQVIFISGTSSNEYIILNLMPSTNYTIEVAAVNSAGIGRYSDQLNQLTFGKSVNKLRRDLVVISVIFSSNSSFDCGGVFSDSHHYISDVD